MAYRARWEHEAFWIVKQDAWGTESDGTANWTMYRETSGSLPTGIDKARQPLGALSTGLSYPVADADGTYNFMDVTRTATQSVTLPLTESVLLNFGSLLVQGYNDDAGAAGADANFLAYVDPNMDMFATTMVHTSAHDDVDSAYMAESMVLRDFNITIPQVSPGETGGLVTATMNLIGAAASRADDTETSDEGSGTTVYDYGAVYQTHGTAFKIGGNAREFVGATINMSNNAALLFEADTSANGAVMGPFAVNGTVTVLDTMGTASTSNTELIAEIERATITPILLEWHWGASADEYIKVYASITEISQPVDIGGCTAYTYTWAMCADGTNAVFKLRSGADSSAALWFEDQTP